MYYIIYKINEKLIKCTDDIFFNSLIPFSFRVQSNTNRIRILINIFK